MHIHHFYPQTSNIGDHFVQWGIKTMIREIVADASFELLSINSRGTNNDYGLTARAIERANREANLVVVGGSNLYEGSYGWHWGVQLDVQALKSLRVPLFLMGIGTGSSFASELHQPSHRARNEIKLLNDAASFSGARDVVTLEWLHKLGVLNAQLTGDPATFIFNRPLQSNRPGPILIALPPRRFFSSKRQFWRVRRLGRPIFKALVDAAMELIQLGNKVVVVCNDPIDLPVARSLFMNSPTIPVRCPQTVEEYFELLSQSRAVISGRLHTAVVSLSLAIPFLLIDADHRTNGFVKTYQLEDWSLDATRAGFDERLKEGIERLFDGKAMESWKLVLHKRDSMFERSTRLLRDALGAAF